MTGRSSFDLDAALARLARAERALRPAVPPALYQRVLTAAALTAAQPGRAARWRLPLIGGAIDGWAGVAAAAAALALIVGLGLGYQAGDMLAVGSGHRTDAGDASLAWAGDWAAESDDLLLVAEDGR